MAKKSQTNARQNNTQTGRSVVNFYNNGTVNIDGRQNRSRTYKTENNGCTINYSHHRIGNPVDNGFKCPDQIELEVLDHEGTAYTYKKPLGSVPPSTQYVKTALLLTGAVVLAAITVSSLFKSN